jgi:hypothetical protein
MGGQLSGAKGYVDGQWSWRAGRPVINPADETLIG